MRAWIIPVTLGLITVAGLIAALVGDGIWDAMSWVALAVPVALCIYRWGRSSMKL